MTIDRGKYLTAQELIKRYGLKGASDKLADRIARLVERGAEDEAATVRQLRAALLDLSDIKFKGDVVN